MAATQQTQPTEGHDTASSRESAGERTLRDEKLEDVGIAGRGPPKKAMYLEVFKAMVGLLVMMWVVACFINGKMYGENRYAHRLKILVADLDGGQIGATLQDTTTSFNGSPGQPTWKPLLYSTDYTLDDIYNKVRDGGNDVWGAIVANPNVTSRLIDYIANPNITEPYESTSVFTLIYNEVRYKTVSAAIIYPALVNAVVQTTAKYQLSYGVQNVDKLPQNSTDINRRALLQPMGYTVRNVKPFGTSNSFLYNTVMFVFPILSQFFLVLAMNGIFNGAGVYATWSFRDNIQIRALFLLANTLLFSLSWAGWIFIFRSSLEFPPSTFALLFLTLWLTTLICFNVIDGLLATVHLRFTPFIIMPWVVCHVAAAISPIVLSNQFYKIEYVLPAHHTWGVLMTIFSGGAGNRLKINLTVLFMWLVIALPGNFWAQKRRWKSFRA